MYEKKEIGIIFPFHSGIFIFPRIHVEKKIKTDIFYSWYLSHYLEKKKTTRETTNGCFSNYGGPCVCACLCVYMSVCFFPENNTD